MRGRGFRIRGMSLAVGLGLAVSVLSSSATGRPLPEGTRSAYTQARPLARREAAEIRRIFGAAAVERRFANPTEVARNWKAVRRFYAGRDYAPAWNRGGGFSPRVGILLEELERAGREGLNPGDYPVAEVAAMLDTTDIQDPRQLAERDVYLSFLFVTYAGHLSRGRLDAPDLRQNWFIGDPGPDLARILADAVEERGVRLALAEVTPAYAGYRGLRAALARYRDMAAAKRWPWVGGRFKLARGDTSARVPRIRELLLRTGDLRPGEEPDSTLRSPVFDAALDEAVRRFQRRHGLLVDGVVGPRTVTEMAVPPRKRVRTLLANLERWRWLPDTLDARYVMVNIPQFELMVVDHGDTVLSMRVVVGNDVNATPVFRNKIQYIETSPQWNVPARIAAEELLPKVIEDPDYLARHRIVVLDEHWQETDPDTMDWTQVNPESLSVHFRQEPGPANPLGSIKFMFPNRFSIYLHDTSNPALFRRSHRDFSHGCVRIEKPVDLAEYLVRGDPRWTRERIEKAMKSKETLRIDLPEPVPVYLLYWTAFVGSGGEVNFRPDLYGSDEALLESLAAYRPRELVPGIFLARLQDAPPPEEKEQAPSGWTASPR